MRHPCRLLKTGKKTAFFNMGLDEAVIESVAAGISAPTLRFYGWEPRAISLGYFQGIRDEIDIEACERSGIDIVRRITGGGAVFHDAEVTYSIVVPRRAPPRPLPPSSTPIRSSARVSFPDWPSSALGRNSLPSTISSGAARKYQGNAQTRKKGCLLQHGTVLLRVDVETMFTVLKVPKEKALGKMIDDVKAEGHFHSRCPPCRSRLRRSGIGHSKRAFRMPWTLI